ncbi:arachidonate 12-lipoxygenase, 12R-type-like [Stigmatopora argus]
MVDYHLSIHTGNRAFASTINTINFKLVGTEGESCCTWYNRLFSWGSTLTISCPKSLGQLVLIELEKQANLIWNIDDWLPDKVVVTSPENDVYTFPIYSWIHDGDIHTFREGKALRIFDDTSSLGWEARKQEMIRRSDKYNWENYQPGLPYCINADGTIDLPRKARFSLTKFIELGYTAVTGVNFILVYCEKAAILFLRFIQRWFWGLENNQENWKNLDQIHLEFDHKGIKVAEFVQQHWKEDWLFGYQFLNGTNPNLIQRIKILPANFPVTDDLIRFPNNSNLAQELKLGNIYLCDFKNLDGMSANIVDGVQQHLMAPLVLLHQRPDDNLMPIAIQLKQKPGEDNPIFLPTDSHHNWLLAKIFVRSAFFAEHQLNAHLLRTHLLAEVFAVSLLRNLPMVHPLYKLLVPHTRYTMQINVLARDLLIGPKSILSRTAAAGGETLFKIIERSLSKTTYRSLCLPDSIHDRDMQQTPNFYYRDDGLRLWDIIYKFVQEIILHYYKSDEEVQRDTELQTYIEDIFKFGFLSNTKSGIPQRFTTVSDLIQFVTMVIFTCSAQHAAVNSGQYDYGGWMPNTPSTLQQAPPSKKCKATENTVLQTLPTKGVTAQGMGTIWLLSQQSSDFVPLGDYPEEHFTEETPRQLQKDFRTSLDELSAKIVSRNTDLKIPYTYLDPSNVENSIAI